MSRDIPEIVRGGREFRRWFEQWWRDDYSTSGLSKRSIELPRDTSRQRIAFAGRMWHPLHCPPFDLEGNECPEFYQIPDNYFTDQYVNNTSRGSSAFLDLRGGFISGFRWSSLQFSTKLDISGAFIGGDVQFEQSPQSGLQVVALGTYFSASLSASGSSSLRFELDRASVYGNTSMASSRTSFLSATGAKFHNSVSISGEFAGIDLSNAIVRAPLSISNVQHAQSLILKSASLHKRADIQQTVVAGAATFTNLRAPGGLFIQDCEFHSGLDATGLKVRGQLKIERLKNCKHIIFDKSNIGGELNITGNAGDIFMRDAAVSMMRNTGAKIGKCDLTGSSSIGYFEFDKCDFSGELILQGFKASDKLAITECTTSIGILAKGIECQKSADFSGTTVGRSCSFREAKFRGGVFFSSQVVGATPTRETASTFGRADFRDAEFWQIGNGYSADFSGREFAGRANFEGATFSAPPYFEREAFKEDVSFRLARFLAPPRPSSERRSFFAFSKKQRQEAKLLARRDDEAFHLAERAYSNLKDAMSNAGSARAERHFHLRELRARRRRRDTEVGASERFISWLYDASSDYGESIRKPVVATVLLPFIFAAIFFAIGGSSDPAHLPEALEFSVQQIFRPFFVWSSTYQVDIDKLNGWQERNLFWAADPALNRHMWSLVIKVLASIESVGSLIFGFLLALAIRRRFQVP